MKLIGSLTSPYVRKARIAFIAKKIDVVLLIDPAWSADSQLPGVNPLGKVPALIMEDGGAMFDSRVIVEYADTLSPVGRLIPSTVKKKPLSRLGRPLQMEFWTQQSWCALKKLGDPVTGNFVKLG